MILERRFEKVDVAITTWMAKNGILCLRIGLGIVFLWFGALKFFPGLSPAEALVRNTVFFFDPEIFIPILAVWEVLIGLGLILGKWMRVTLLLLFLQMPGTALPILVLPDVVWNSFPFALTMEANISLKISYW